MAIKKILICGDSHGDHLDLRAAEALFAFKKEYKPDTLVHLGDALDLACMRNGASKEDLALSLKQDFKEGCDFLKEFFKGKAENKIFLWGNHDQRLLDVMGSSSAIAADHAETMYLEFVRVLKRCGVDKADGFYDSRSGVAELYPFRFVHGYSCAQNTAKFHAEKYGGKFPCVVFGHTHYSGYWREITYDRIDAYACSCMCDIDPSYASRNTSKLRHSIGWLFGWYDDDDGSYQLYPVEGKTTNGRMTFTATSKLKEY